MACSAAGVSAWCSNSQGQHDATVYRGLQLHSSEQGAASAVLWAGRTSRGTLKRVLPATPRGFGQAEEPPESHMSKRDT